MEEKQEKNLKHKGFLLFLKYNLHLLALLYAVYTIFQFIGIDLIMLGHLIHVSIGTWIFMYLTSKIFRFCYIHRFPLYYIALNELITNIDYYIRIPIDTIHILLIHLLLIFVLMFGYSYYYIKYILKNDKIIKEYPTTIY